MEHVCLLKSMYLGTAATEFHVTRLTEASFIVSTPKSIDPRKLRSIRPDARYGRVTKAKQSTANLRVGVPLLKMVAIIIAEAVPGSLDLGSRRRGPARALC